MINPIYADRNIDKMDAGALAVIAAGCVIIDERKKKTGKRRRCRVKEWFYADFVLVPSTKFYLNRVQIVEKTTRNIDARMQSALTLYHIGRVAYAKVARYTPDKLFLNLKKK